MKLHFGDGHFDCSGCGDCCRADWNIRVEPTKASRLSRILADQPPIEAVLPKRCGQCVFLDSAQRCTVHQDKPLDCQLFPFVLTPTPDGLEVGLSHFCPSVRAAKGRSLAEHAERIEELAAEAELPLTLSGPYTLWGEYQVGWSGYRVWESELLRRLEGGEPEAVLLAALAGLWKHRAHWGRTSLDSLFPQSGMPSHCRGVVRLRELAGLSESEQLDYDCRTYLLSLVQRKTLLKTESILTGLAVLSVVPRVLASSGGDSAVAKMELLLSHDGGRCKRELADLGVSLIMELCPSTLESRSPPKDPPPTPHSTPAQE